MLDGSGQRILRAELHGPEFEDPNHVDIQTNRQEVADTIRHLFQLGRKYVLGNVYLWDENNPEKDREQLK